MSANSPTLDTRTNDHQQRWHWWRKASSRVVQGLTSLGIATCTDEVVRKNRSMLLVDDPPHLPTEVQGEEDKEVATIFDVSVSLSAL